MKQVVLTASILTVAGLLCTGCSSVPNSFSVRAAHQNMSLGVGPVTDGCGQFKFSDPRCNPALSAGGGN